MYAQGKVLMRLHRLATPPACMTDTADLPSMRFIRRLICQVLWQEQQGSLV